jgi:drug/metabolite transporter (DMT)-like permease
VARAIIIIILAIFSFAAMGVVVRILTADYPVLQISFIRNFFGFLPILLLLGYSHQMHELKTPFTRLEWGVCMLRGASVSIAQYCLFMAYSLLEFATASTLVFAGPFFVTALSVPVLGMRVGLWRWSAVCMGFAGVVMIMRPGAGVFTLYAVLPVLAAFCYAVSSTAVKIFSSNRLSGVIQFRSQIFAALFSLGLWLSFAEVTPIASGLDLGLFIALGLLGGFGVLGLVVAYRMTQPSLLAPFEYFGIPFSLLLGWWFFGEAPINRLFPGVLAIVAGGMVIIWRQMRVTPQG